MTTPEKADVAIVRVEVVEGGFRPGSKKAEVSIELTAQMLVLVQGVPETRVQAVVAVNLGSTKNNQDRAMQT